MMKNNMMLSMMRNNMMLSMMKKNMMVMDSISVILMKMMKMKKKRSFGKCTCKVSS